MARIAGPTGHLRDIVYVDRFGNAIDRAESGHEPPNARLVVAGGGIGAREDFERSLVGRGLYENSNGLAEIAVNQARADHELGLAIGIPVEIVS